MLILEQALGLESLFHTPGSDTEPALPLLLSDLILACSWPSHGRGYGKSSDGPLPSFPGALGPLQTLRPETPRAGLIS